MYEVPSHRHYNDALAGRLAVELRSLVDRPNSEYNNTADMKSENGDSGDSNGKHDNNNGNGKHDNNHEHGLHSLQNRDAPTPPSETIPNGNVHFPIEALPHGLQFLNRHSQERRLQNLDNAIPSQSNGINLDLQTLLGDMADTTTVPSVTNSDAFLSTSKVMDLGFLLGGLGGPSNNHHGHEISHHGHSDGHQSHEHGHIHSSNDHGHTADHGHQVHGHPQTLGNRGHEHEIMSIDTNSGPSRNSVNEKMHASKGPERRLGNLFNGMFNQHSSHAPQGHGGHGDHGHGSQIHASHMHNEVTVPTTSSGSAGIQYEQSTMHARPITKRGVADSETVSRFSKTFIDNILNIRIGTTVQPHSIVQTTLPTRYSGYLTTPRSVETQTERLSGVQINTSKHTHHETPQSVQQKQDLNAPNIVTPSPKELVHLQGIHIMFSDGKQDTSRTIPTVHLTASISENVNHLLNMAASGGQISSTQSPNVNSITDKITGTAVIRDGHLYLVVYPFGSNKSLELHYNQSTKRMAMPHNKPVSYSKTKAPVLKTEPVTPKLPLRNAHSTNSSSHSALVNPTSETKVTSTGHSDHHHVSTGSDIHSSPHSHIHATKSESSTKSGLGKSIHAHGHHQHDHGHQHHSHQHSSSTPSLTGLKLAEVNDTTLQTLLSPINRFISPWESLNFSNVFPYSAGKNSSATTTSPKKHLDDDSEVDVVTFVAKAADPFDQMKAIIQSLVNKTLLNTSNITTSQSQNGNSTEARFNFELKLQPTSTKNSVQTTTNPNNSEEKAFDTNGKTSAFNSKTFGNINKVTDSTPASDFTTSDIIKPFNDVTPDSFGKSSGEITTMSNINDFKNTPKINYQTTTEANLANDVLLSGTHLIDINRSKNIVKISTDSPNQKPTTEMYSKFNHFLHASENIAPSTLNTLKVNKRPSDFFDTTLSYIPNYTESPTTKRQVYQVTTPSSQRRKTISRNLQTGPRRNTILGSNLQPFVQRTSPNKHRQDMNRVQSEQIISLADILNDIRRIQLHNMQRFNIQNSNFDTMMLSEAKQTPVIRTPLVMEGPVIRETSTRRYSDFPAFMNINNKKTQERSNVMPQNSAPLDHRRVNRNAHYDSDMEAMLVLSVDDIMNDQTALHGAIVFSHRRNPSLSNII